MFFSCSRRQQSTKCTHNGSMFKFNDSTLSIHIRIPTTSRFFFLRLFVPFRSLWFSFANQKFSSSFSQVGAFHCVSGKLAFFAQIQLWNEFRYHVFFCSLDFFCSSQPFLYRFFITFFLLFILSALTCRAHDVCESNCASLREKMIKIHVQCMCH